jgi:hypothetical protein
MTHLASFVTSKFDPSLEPPNEFNPIPGKSVLDWLRSDVLDGKALSTEPDTEDWGWYMNVEYGTSTYMVGGCCLNDYDEPPMPGEYEWIIQVHKRRSIVDRLLGKNKHSKNDALSTLIFVAVRSEEDFTGESFDTNA